MQDTKITGKNSFRRNVIFLFVHIDLASVRSLQTILRRDARGNADGHTVKLRAAVTKAHSKFQFHVTGY